MFSQDLGGFQWHKCSLCSIIQNSFSGSDAIIPLLTRLSLHWQLWNRAFVSNKQSVTQSLQRWKQSKAANPHFRETEPDNIWHFAWWMTTNVGWTCFVGMKKTNHKQDLLFQARKRTHCEDQSDQTTQQPLQQHADCPCVYLLVCCDRSIGCSATRDVAGGRTKQTSW